MAFKETFGGGISFDSSLNGCYKWSIQSEKDVRSFIEYAKKHQFRSHKVKRFFLVPEYYRLKKLSSFRPESLYNNAWLKFDSKWMQMKL